MASWRDFWNADTPIYVSERHKLLHYRGIAADIVPLIPGPDAQVLDFGCGEALAADRVAERCGHLFLCDAAPLVRERLEDRFGDNPRISVLAPEALSTQPDGTFDLVVANSVLQYLSLEELRGLLRVWRAKLKPHGRLVLADVVPPDVSPVADARALLAFAWRGGFLTRAVTGLVRTALSDYRKLRDELGLAQYTEAEIHDILGEADFVAERQPRNIGHNQARMTFVARPSRDD